MQSIKTKIRKKLSMLSYKNFVESKLRFNFRPITCISTQKYLIEFKSEILSHNNRDFAAKQKILNEW